MGKRFLIAGNWKMNKTAAETQAFFDTLRVSSTPTVHAELLICPPFTSLAAASKANASIGISLGAQNVHPKASGAFTGEISPSMLKEYVSYVLIGHSERRILLHETDAFINEKLHALLRANLKPILCVGETLSERQDHRAFDVISRQLEEGVKGITSEQLAYVTVAYEPVWAIGTGETATPEMAEEVHAFMYNWLRQRFEASIVEKVRLLYGGSLKVDNAQALFCQPHINGGLIGGASLEAYSFIEIARIADAVAKDGV